MTLQLESITLAGDPEQGGPLQLRIILPPNLVAAAKSGSIAVKLEADTANGRQPLGQLNQAVAYRPDVAHLLALALLESWNDGKLPSLARLSTDQLRQLLQPMDGQDAVFTWNQPEVPLSWHEGKINGVHDALTAESPAPPAQGRSVPSARKPTRSRPEPAAGTVCATPPLVDGSANFLAITLPARSHPHYSAILSLLQEWNFRLEPSNRKWWLRDRHRSLAFLAAHWSDLENLYGAEFSDNFRQKTAELKRATLQVATDPADGNAFLVEVGLHAPGVDGGSLRLGMEKGMPYVQGSDGIVLLEKSTLAALAEARTALLAETTRHGDTGPRLRRRISSAELAMADAALEALGTAFSPPDTWKARADTLRHRRNLPLPPLPSHWQTVLRPYQSLGVAWLWHLRENDLGGVLADEMGLGKTLQTLALIECIRKEDTENPALVVCPAALVENWRREAMRFAPDLKVFTHHGNNRLTEPLDFSSHGLIITSYGTLVRDAELFQPVRFSCIAGDEAQHIKNRDTRNARALRRLQGDFRMLLTGTPIENSLDDLYSLFEFVMPGLLPKPGGTGQGTGADPRPRAAPFILRRTKLEVAPELPDKIEQTVFCEMTDKQAGLYRELERRAQVELLDLQGGGAGDARLRFVAFRQLLRLRQICADPRLLDEACGPGDSAKASAFGELLEEALDTGRRMLVFSQFTSLLRLVGADMAAQGIPFFYLDGQTRDRAALCQRFNDDPAVPVFLISLKAGGAGLNLTGADTVVHLDPWWNPAVEAQATARAHRIGQTKTVFSYRLIVSGTVEERVLSLQKNKAGLLQELLGGDAGGSDAIGLETLRELIGL